MSALVGYRAGAMAGERRWPRGRNSLGNALHEQAAEIVRGRFRVLLVRADTLMGPGYDRALTAAMAAHAAASAMVDEGRGLAEIADRIDGFVAEYERAEARARRPWWRPW